MAENPRFHHFSFTLPKEESGKLWVVLEEEYRNRVRPYGQRTVEGIYIDKQGRQTQYPLIEISGTCFADPERFLDQLKSKEIEMHGHSFTRFVAIATGNIEQ